MVSGWCCLVWLWRLRSLLVVGVSVLFGCGGSGGCNGEWFVLSCLVVVVKMVVMISYWLVSGLVVVVKVTVMLTCWLLLLSGLVVVVKVVDLVGLWHGPVPRVACMRRGRGPVPAHLRGWWMCWLRCWAGGSFCTAGTGFWWATCAAAGVKSLSPLTTTPEMTTVGFGGLLLTYSSSSFSSFFSGGAGSPAAWCFWTTLIPPTFTAGRCPALVSIFSFGGDDISILTSQQNARPRPSISGNFLLFFRANEM